MSMTVTRKFHVRKQQKGRKELRQGGAKPEVPVGRVPRISRLMALAIRFDEMIRSGEVKDQAELARLGHVTRARLTQIMNLLSLAPDIQETILFVRPTMGGRDRITERNMRLIVAVIDWQDQRQKWSAIVAAEN